MFLTTICSHIDDQSHNPRLSSAVIRLITFAILSSSLVFPRQQEDSPNSTHSLTGVHGIEFGMNKQQIVQRMNDRFKDLSTVEITRENYIIMEFQGVKSEKVRSVDLRFFLVPENGLFQIDEVYILRWDLQRPDRDNLEIHRRVLDQLLVRLRKEHGKEALLEETDLASRFRQEDFVTATWSFPDDRWIHVIYEPQDWSVFPEMNKILVSYRHASADPRLR